MTAVAATFPLIALDTESSAIETAAKQIRDAILKGGVIALAGVVCWRLRQTQKAGDALRVRLSNVTIRTPKDRALLREIATNFGQAAQALACAYETGESHQIDRIPMYGRKLMTRLNSLVTMFEDMAETAALGANEAFAESLRRDLRENLDSHRQHAAV